MTEIKKHKEIDDDFIQDLSENSEELTKFFGVAFDSKAKLPARKHSAQLLMLVSDKFPHKLYEQWDFCWEILDSKDELSVIWALHLLSNLCSVDKEDYFHEKFDRYFDLLGSQNTKIAIKATERTAAIVVGKPYWEARITKKLLDLCNLQIDESVKGAIIEVLSSYFDIASHKVDIINVAVKLSSSSDVKAAKKAVVFLKKRKIKIYKSK